MRGLETRFLGERQRAGDPLPGSAISMTGLILKFIFRGKCARVVDCPASSCSVPVRLHRPITARTVPSNDSSQYGIVTSRVNDLKVSKLESISKDLRKSEFPVIVPISGERTSAGPPKASLGSPPSSLGAARLSISVYEPEFAPPIAFKRTDPETESNPIK